MKPIFSIDAIPQIVSRETIFLTALGMHVNSSG